MKDLVEKLRMSTAMFSPPVQSLLDIDFYKFTMAQAILEHHPDEEVTFKLIVRDNTLPVADMVSETELRKCLEYVQGLRFTPTDLSYLRGINLYNDYLLKDKFIQFLRTLKLPPYKLFKRDGAYELTFTGKWPEVTFWETIALAIISELYYRFVMRNMPRHELEMVYDRARVKIYEKLEKLLTDPDITFADFGQRRRHSFLWQEWVIGICKSMMGKQFTGTSNTWMAFHHDLTPIGTNAHEMPMVYVALADSAEAKIDAQYQVLRDWAQMYGEGLRIMLPDTYTSEQFFKNAPDWVAKWKGFRQDSGDPLTRGDLYIKWLEGHGVDPRTKLMIASDGLDVSSMFRIRGHFGKRLLTSNGWGTLVTNDFRGCHTNPLLRPFSMVCKVVEVNGRPCVKISDNPNKHTGPEEEVEKYKREFGVGEQEKQDILV
jgi:nicotinate phosphoribosyltransferase